MRRIHCILVFLLLQSCTPAQKDTSPSTQMKKVESGLIHQVYLEGDSTWTIEERMKHYGVPGVSIAVIKDNKIDWVKTYGVMDKETNEPVTEVTLFQAGSISKPVSAYAALHLVEQGKLDLDKNVNDFLLSWKVPDNEFTKDRKVTLKGLLSHTAGTSVHGFLGYSPDLPVPTLVEVLNGKSPANSPPIRVDKIPGGDFRYSGGGYSIMQLMMIETEKKTFPQILMESVLQPLRMSHSTYEQPLPPDKLKVAATGYLPDGTMTKGRRHTYPEMAAAGLWTTSEDLALFAIDIQQTLKGESSRVISKSMAEKMLTPVYQNFIGLGIFIADHDGEIYFNHGGWDEGFSSMMVAHKTKGYGVAILTNSNHPEFLDELVRSVATTYAWDNFVPTYKKLLTDSSAFSAITGRYRNGSDGLIRIYSKDGNLFLKYLRGEPNQLFKVTDSTFAMRDDTRRVQFVVNPVDKKRNLVFVSSGQKDRVLEHPVLKEDENVPYESLLAGRFEEALKGYQDLLKANPKDEALQENNINEAGYRLMSQGKLILAKDLFKINMNLYPKSPNVYDSYAEACVKNGDKELAITNYKKSLALDPKNKAAVAKIEELSKK